MENLDCKVAESDSQNQNSGTITEDDKFDDQKLTEQSISNDNILHGTKQTHELEQTRSKELHDSSLKLKLDKALKDFESMVLKYAKSEQENMSKRNKLNSLEKRVAKMISDNEQLSHRIKVLRKENETLSDNLNDKIVKLAILENSKLKEQEERNKLLTNENESLKKDLKTHKETESNLLVVSEKLSMQQLILLSDLRQANAKLVHQDEQLVKQKDMYLKKIRKLLCKATKP